MTLIIIEKDRWGTWAPPSTGGRTQDAQTYLPFSFQHALEEHGASFSQQCEREGGCRGLKRPNLGWERWHRHQTGNYHFRFSWSHYRAPWPFCPWRPWQPVGSPPNSVPYVTCSYWPKKLSYNLLKLEGLEVLVLSHLLLLLGLDLCNMIRILLLNLLLPG